METEKMIYLVLEYASGGEIFGNLIIIAGRSYLRLFTFK